MNEEIGDPMASSLLTNIGDNRIADDEVIFRYLQHSQLQNALIRHKAQRFLALKTLGRSVVLRRQLSHAKKAASSGGVAGPTPAPPLDPSVKALIEKLTEIADILPGYRDDQQHGQPRQHARTPYGRGEPNNEQERAEAGYSSRSHANEGKAPQVASTTTATETPAGESETIGHLSDGTHKDEGHRSKMGGDEMEAAEEGSPGPSAQLHEEYMIPAEEEGDIILGQQLRELDLNMSTMFQDLEKKVKPDVGGKDPEFSKEREEEKKQEEENRQKERAALLVQLEGLSSGGLTRRPKWRWIAEGIDDPHPDRVLKGKHLWKAATMLIIVFYVRPKKALMQRKAR